MNELTRRIAKQAGFEYIKDEGIGWAGNHNNSLPKFAELLIKECANIAYHYDGLTLGQGYTVARHIKKQFGIEE